MKRNCQYKLGGLPFPASTCQTLFIEFPHIHNLIPQRVSVVCRVTDDSVVEVPALLLLFHL